MMKSMTEPMAKEIERKFLVTGDGWKTITGDSIIIEQAYIAVMDDRSVRIRTRNGETAMLTIKVGQNNFMRDEFEYPIPLLDAREMMTLSVGRVICKTRHLVRFDNFLWEVDVFEGHLQGLLIAEVELENEHQKPALPDWVGAEVTGDRRYSNQALALEAGVPEVTDVVPS